MFGAVIAPTSILTRSTNLNATKLPVVLIKCTLDNQSPSPPLARRLVQQSPKPAPLGRHKPARLRRPQGSLAARMHQPLQQGSLAQVRAPLPACAPLPVSPQDRAPVPAAHPKARAPLPAPTSLPQALPPSMATTTRSRAWESSRTDTMRTRQWLAA